MCFLPYLGICCGAVHCSGWILCEVDLPKAIELWAGRKLLCGGGGDGTEAHLPNPPLPLLGRRAGRGVWAGAALPAVPGGGSNPNIHGSK